MFIYLVSSVSLLLNPGEEKELLIYFRNKNEYGFSENILDFNLTDELIKNNIHINVLKKIKSKEKF